VHALGIFSHTPADHRVWIRLERGLEKKDKTIEMVTDTVPAFDTATIAYHQKDVVPPHAIPTDTLEFKEVTLKHLLILLSMMHDTVTGYNLFKVCFLGLQQIGC
jgi:hypothetical protein